MRSAQMRPDWRFPARGNGPEMHAMPRGRRSPRETIPGRLVRITDADGLMADVDGFGRLNIRLACLPAGTTIERNAHLER